MKKNILLFSIFLLALPQLSSAQTLQTFLTNIPGFINGTLIPFLFGIVFLIFIINVVRYFVIKGGNEDDHTKAKDLILYSLAAFVFLIVFFGLVNMFVVATGLEGEAPPCPDYLKGAKGGC